MNALDAMGLFGAAIPFLVGAGLLWFIGGMPGRVAKKNDHPDADAIRVGGWASLLLGVVGWPWVLMWAYREPPSTKDNSADLSRLSERVADLERLLAQMQANSEVGADQ